MTPLPHHRRDMLPERKQRRLGAGVVWLTALVIVPVVIAELQARRLPDAPAPAPALAAAAQVPREMGDAPLAGRVIVLTPPPVRPLQPAPANVTPPPVVLTPPPFLRPVALVVPDLKRELLVPRGSGIAYRRGIVRSDLYAAGFVAGVPPTVLAAMIREFSHDIDFQRDMRSGDSFEVAFDGQSLRYAALTLRGKRHAIYRFTRRDGSEDWFDEHGASARRTLLRTPVDGGRLTSGFGRRADPWLGYTTTHRGVDFGAASGAPVYAAGDGVVEIAERLGGYGNYLRIRHDGQLSTAYAHLQRFAASVGPGSTVRQGQVIGYVGATGRVTATHLHFEVLRGGTQVNPMTVNMAVGGRLEGADLVAFKAARASLDIQVAALARPKSMVAKAE